MKSQYRQTWSISHTLVGNEIVDHSDVVGASPVGAPSNLHSRLNTWLQWIGQRQLQGETRNISVLVFAAPYIRDSMVTAFKKHKWRAKYSVCVFVCIHTSTHLVLHRLSSGGPSVCVCVWVIYIWESWQNLLSRHAYVSISRQIHCPRRKSGPPFLSMGAVFCEIDSGVWHPTVYFTKYGPKTDRATQNCALNSIFDDLWMIVRVVEYPALWKLPRHTILISSLRLEWKYQLSMPIYHFTAMAIPTKEISRSKDRLMSMMGFATDVKQFSVMVNKQRARNTLLS